MLFDGCSGLDWVSGDLGSILLAIVLLFALGYVSDRASDLDPFPANRARSVVIRPGDRVEVLGPLEPRPDPTAPSGLSRAGVEHPHGEGRSAPASSVGGRGNHRPRENRAQR
jgi:hypothetical protein